VCIVVVVLCGFCHLMCICCTVCELLFFTLDAGLLARSQYSEGPATGHLDTSFSCFPCVYKQMLRWIPTFQVATTCFSCSPPDLNLVVTNFMFCLHVKQPLPPGNNPIAVNKYILNILKYMVVFLFNTVIYVSLLLCLCILIVCLRIFIVPAGTLRLP